MIEICPILEIQDSWAGQVIESIEKQYVEEILNNHTNMVGKKKALWSKKEIHQHYTNKHEESFQRANSSFLP